MASESIQISADQLISKINGIYTPQLPLSNYTVTNDFELHFQSSAGNTIITFETCKFEDNFTLSASDSFTGIIVFRNCIFNKGFSLKDLKGQVVIGQTIFWDNFSIDANDLELKMLICDFKKAVEFRGEFYGVDLSELTSIESSSEKGFHFHGRVKRSFSLAESRLGNGSFIGSNFEGVFLMANITIARSRNKPFSIINCAFHSRVNLHNIFSEVRLYFTSCQFKGSADFFELKVEQNAIELFGLKFDASSSIKNSHCTSLLLKHCLFVEFAAIRHTRANEIEIVDTIFLKGADFLHSDFKVGNRETFRIIKNEFLKINNQVEAQHYNAKEMSAYKNELIERRQIAELFLVYLNRLSNFHGLSWSRGVLFTLSVGIGFYLLYILSLGSLPFAWGWKGWESFWQATGVNIKYFIRFFIVTHD